MSKTFPCCQHCVDDPVFHEENPRDSHTTSCPTCEHTKVILDRVEIAIVLHKATQEYHKKRHGEMPHQEWDDDPYKRDLYLMRADAVLAALRGER